MPGFELMSLCALVYILHVSCLAIIPKHGSSHK